LPSNLREKLPQEKQRDFVVGKQKKKKEKEKREITKFISCWSFMSCPLYRVTSEQVSKQM